MIAWGCRIHQPNLSWGVRPTHNECTGYDTKRYFVEVPVMLELWRMRTSSSLPSLPGSLWPGVVSPDSVLSKAQIGLKCILMLNWTILIF